MTSTTHPRTCASSSPRRDRARARERVSDVAHRSVRSAAPWRTAWRAWERRVAVCAMHETKGTERVILIYILYILRPLLLISLSCKSHTIAACDLCFRREARRWPTDRADAPFDARARPRAPIVSRALVVHRPCPAPRVTCPRSSSSSSVTAVPVRRDSPRLSRRRLSQCRV